MRKDHKHLFSMLMRFTLGFFLITVVSAVFIVTLVGILHRLGWLDVAPALTILSFAFIASAIFGTIMALVVGRRYLGRYETIEAALTKIGEGDFSVKLDETQGNKFLRKTSHDINALAHNLRQVEIMRRDFIADFSHEFKTPIVSIQGFAKRLLDKSLTEEQRADYALIIYDESKRLAALAENTLLMNRLDNLGVLGEVSVFALDESVRKAMILLEKSWTSKNITPEIDLPSMMYRGNEGLLKEVWINLLTNAIKFSPVGSSIYITASDSGDMYKIEVSDQGRGIEAAYLERIFDKFYQENHASTLGGNGLGLSIAKRIVELSGGRIEVTSTVGKGTTFCVLLPKNIKD